MIGIKEKKHVKQRYGVSEEIKGLWNLKNRTMVAIIIIIMEAVTLSGCGMRDFEADMQDCIDETAGYLTETVASPESAQVGGEWTVKGLTASGTDIGEDYLNLYYDSLRARVKSTKGILDAEYNTEYARAVIGVCAIGKDPRDVEGYDLIAPLDDYEKITSQGVNAAAYALVASNVAGEKLENEDKYIQYIIDDIENGSIAGEDYYSDYVSMAVLGLSFYTDRENIEAAVDEYIAMMSDMQNDDASIGNCESNAEAIIALSQAGVDVLNDERFVKDGKNLTDALMEFRLKDGSFCHKTEEKEANVMSTEKALLAMDSVMLAQSGHKLYESRQDI